MTTNGNSERPEELLQPIQQREISKRQWFFLFTMAYFPNGQLAYVQVSVGGVVIVLLALVLKYLPWAEAAHLLAKLGNPFG